MGVEAWGGGAGEGKAAVGLCARPGVVAVMGLGVKSRCCAVRTVEKDHCALCYMHLQQ